MVARTKTDTGGQGEYPKVSERIVVKELCKIVPYVRKKGRSKEPQRRGPSDCLSKTQLSAKSKDDV